MAVLTIRGVVVDFPFEPYACQVDYMEKVIQCLQEGTNGILESPTGTGKTLCLLCATLAWRETYMAHLQLNIKIQESKASGKFCESLQEGLGQAAKGWTAEENEGPVYDVPKIIYTSRTHSQLSQAVNELKNTIYKPKVCVLGSREQMCIHSDVLKQESNTAKVHLCRSKVSARSCHYYNNLEGKQTDNDFSKDILDIEDLVRLGNKHSVCPYYLSRNQKKTADVVFMPYNYLLDAKSRSANNVDISNSVIVFDEAHNLEKNCEEAVSFDLTSFDIASCVDDLDRCLDMITTMEEEGTLGLNEDSAEGGIDKKEVAYMKGLFLNFEEELHNISSSSSQGITKPGSYIFELLGKVKITLDTHHMVVELLDKCNTFLAANSNALKGKHFSLGKFSDALKIVFKTDDCLGRDVQADQKSRHYKVRIETQNDSESKKRQLDVWSSSKAASRNEGYSLGYWCFSPGETMKDLVRSKLRSVILTSGTLSPLPSFKAELQIDIPVQLQNAHVIKEHQMSVGILKAGPDGVSLNSSYQNRNKPEYLNSLGNTLVNFARIVPDGLLVFFPSYTVLNMCVSHWQSSGVWDRINQIKQVFVEPRRKTEFIEVMEGFYEKIRHPTNRGATFFAVCRGKVSEGLDFADENGRAVVITGLPYPPQHDSRVKLKMGFLDEMKSKRTFKGLTGRDWYQQQASRAVNQAVGRVLRHKEDYGAIILCDERFLFSNNLAELPLWVRPYIKKYNNFGELQRHLTHFFRQADRLCVKSHTNPKLPENSSISAHKAERASASSVFCKEPYNNDLRRKHIHSRLDTRRYDIPKESPLQIQCEVRNSRLQSLMLSRLSQSSKKDGPEKAKPKGFFDSLDVYETENRKTASQGTLSVEKSNIFGSGSTDPPNEPPAVHTAVKKKLKIVRSKNPPIATENDQESDAPDKVVSAKKYLTKVMTSLGREDFATFSAILKEYKQRNDLSSLLRSLTPLFLREKQHYNLFLEFSFYIKSPIQKEEFFQKYIDLTGEEVPEEYRRRKRPTISETTKLKKKQRTESG